jgi:hypothetical protein
MAVGDLWFGNATLFAAVQAPPSMVADRAGWFDRLGLENGGQAVDRAAAAARQIRMTYPWTDAGEPSSAELFEEFRSGEHGPGPFYLANLAAYDRNLFEPRFASPMLCEVGWPSSVAGSVSFSATAANSYRQPWRKGTWSVTTPANASPATDASIPFTVIPVPPEYTLHLGCTGTATGTAVVRVESYANGATSADATTDLTLLSETGATRLNATVDGGSYAFAKVFVTRTSSADSTITPISMMAQLWPSGMTPAMTGPHVRGKGWSALEFGDEVMSVEFTDSSDGRHYQGLTVRLDEVGAWQ